MIASVITAAKAKGCKIGICGQAPSDYPEFASSWSSRALTVSR